VLLFPCASHIFSFLFPAPQFLFSSLSRRFLWDFISTTMSGRAVILTTHSYAFQFVVAAMFAFLTKADNRAGEENILMFTCCVAFVSLSIRVSISVLVFLSVFAFV
jgi:hypothetical protein